MPISKTLILANLLLHITQITLAGSCNPNLTPNEHLRPACYLNETSQATLTPTSTGMTKISFTGNAAHMMYLHLTYQLEVETNQFQPFRNLVVAKDMACRKNVTQYSCESYFNPTTSTFVQTRLSTTPFSLSEVGNTLPASAKNISIKTFQSGAPFGSLNIELVGSNTMTLFDLLSSKHGKTTTRDCRSLGIGIGLSRDRYTATNGTIYCFTNAEGLISNPIPQCRIVQNVTQGRFIPAPVDSEIQYGKKCSDTIHVIGTWNDRGEEQIPEE